MSGEYPSHDDIESNEEVFSQDSQEQQSSTLSEQVEIPTLSLSVSERCKSSGSYVGLNAQQRKALHVEVGDVVEFLDESGNVVHLLTVGKGKKGLSEGQCTANDVKFGTYQIRKAVNTSDTLHEYAYSFGLENDEKHGKRRGKIQKLASEQGLKNFDPDVYVRVPTALGKMLGFEQGATPTVLKVSLGRIRFAGKERQVGFVPAGSDIAFTSKAVSSLGLQQTNKSLPVRVEDGVLVID